ncbi:MAG: ATP-grasp domain-containing protein, partial [Candidatus Komeilibacteria bacterium]|nr:ATP-grasp domain-containing protein [Candidatus Komeilibacteria bacterium]
MNSDNPANANDLFGKKIIFINVGSYKKKFILERAKELGAIIILVNSRLPLWAKSLIDYYIEADTYVPENVIDRLKKFLKENKTTVEKFDGVITFWEDDVPIQAAVAAEFNLIDNSPEVAQQCRNKYLMREVLKEKGVLCAKQRLLLNAEDLEVAIKEIGFPAVLKPAWGADSEFVVKANNEEEARQIYDYIFKNATPKFNPIFKYNQSQFIYEEYLEGIEVATESLTQNGQTQVIAISEKMPMKEPYFMERGDIMPSRFESPTLKKVQEIVEEAHKALGIQNSISHTEVKVTPVGPAIVEVAARMGGDYLCDWVKTVWEVDLVEQGLRICTGLPINAQKTSKPKVFLAGTYLIPENSGVVTGLR